MPIVFLGSTPSQPKPPSHKSPEHGVLALFVISFFAIAIGALYLNNIGLEVSTGNAAKLRNQSAPKTEGFSCSATPSTVNSDQPATFSAEGNTRQNVRWEFDDSTTVIGNPVQKSFHGVVSNAPYATHWATAYDGVGQNTPDTTCSINVRNIPLISCGASPSSVAIGDTVIFTADTDFQGIFKWSGDIGTNTNPGPADTFQTTYTSSGTKNVTVQVAPLTGGPSTNCSVEVLEQSNTGGDLNVSVSAAPSSGRAPLNSTITATVQGNTHGKDIEYTFDCDNGQTKYASGTPNKTVSRTCNYTSDGTYSVLVTVNVDELNLDGHGSATVQVGNSTNGGGGGAACTIDINPSTVAPGGSVNITWNTDDADNQVAWSCAGPGGTLGGGTVAANSTGQGVPVYIPSNASSGNYHCDLGPVVNSAGQTKSCSDSLTVSSSGGTPAPTCRLDFGQVETHANGSVTVWYEYRTSGDADGQVLVACDWAPSFYAAEDHSGFADITSLSPGLHRCTIWVEPADGPEISCGNFFIRP